MPILLFNTPVAVIKTPIKMTNKTPRCGKIDCSNFLSSRHHPTWYSNGLCERHFFEMDLDRNLTKKNSIHHRYQPLRDDIRNTREIFDGHQW